MRASGRGPVEGAVSSQTCAMPPTPLAPAPCSQGSPGHGKSLPLSASPSLSISISRFLSVSLSLPSTLSLSLFTLLVLCLSLSHFLLLFSLFFFLSLYPGLFALCVLSPSLSPFPYFSLILRLFLYLVASLSFLASPSLCPYFLWPGYSSLSLGKACGWHRKRVALGMAVGGG